MKDQITFIRTILKRDGREDRFDIDRIKEAVHKCFKANEINSPKIVNEITEKVVNDLIEEGNPTCTVEHVQDLVEREIDSAGYYKVARSFAMYREHRTNERKAKNGVYKTIKTVITETDRENANVGHGPSSKLLQIAEAANKDYAESFLTREDVRNAVKSNKIYPHDYSWASIGTTTCTFIPLGKSLDNGFNTGHGHIRKPKRIKTAVLLSCIMFQSNQNDQHGGQAFGWYDRDMATYVDAEYKWQVTRVMETLYDTGFIEKELPSLSELLGVDENQYIEESQILSLLENIDEEKYKDFLRKFDEVFNSLPATLQKRIKKAAWKYTIQETYQAMESLVFNLNTMHSRAGAQVPFTSINFGTDTSKEGRIVTKTLLLAYRAGLGKGEQPIFPNLIFKVKSGINFEKNDPNYDLLMLSLKTTAKRLFPNYVFMDCTLNKDFPTDVPVMGCRTRISWNKLKPIEEQTCEGRGNISFTTLNLPGVALGARYHYTETIGFKFQDLKEKYKLNIPKKYEPNANIKTFFVELDAQIELSIIQLLDRLAYQGTFKKADFPFLMSGIWMDSEKLSLNDKVLDVIKNGSLAAGFIGLAETLYALVGEHHGQSKNADALGEEIIRYMSTKMDEAADKHNLNFSLLATPAEGLSGKFTEKDKREYGIVEGVTDKEWYTNSFHVPVEYEINLFEKVKIEGKYHKYCNGGNITYVELKEVPVDNEEGMYTILKAMKESDCSYVALNFPIDRCKNCGFDGIIDTPNCPICSSANISRIRRITGYLSELSNFNYAKHKEAMRRVKHY